MRLATRGSPLALWQAEFVAELLRRSDPSLEVELVKVETTGDRDAARPVWEMGGQGVFVKEVQAAVLDGRADAGVHSAKDLPSTEVDGLVIAALPARGDPRDALVGGSVRDLAPGAVVATGSVRRRAQMSWLRPDLTFVSLRGNIGTRLSKLPPGGALVMAAAALDRLGLQPAATVERLPVEDMLPQVGQGAVAVECREDDEPTLTRLAALDHPPTRLAVTAERSFLAELGGGCDLPAGAHARCTEDGMVVEGLLATLDGRLLLRTSRPSRLDPAAAAASGRRVAEDLLSAGGRALLQR